MKKLLPYIIALSILLCGCAPSAVDEIPTELPSNHDAALSEPTTTDSDLPLDDDAPIYWQQPMISVSMPLVTEYTTINDTDIFYYTYQNIYLSVQDQQIADSIIINYLNRLDRTRAFSQDLAQQATEAYSDGDTWNPHFLEYVYSPTRIDAGVLSLYGRNVIYSGGQHAEQEGISINYNMLTGEVLTLGSILCHADVIDELCALTTEALDELVGTLSLFEDYPEVVAQRFTRDPSYDEDWFFTKTGLAFYFAPYEIAPYTSGVVTVEVPYEKLTGIITDEFFPAETDNSEGNVIGTTLSEIDIDSFTQIAELELNPDGEQIFLYCDGIVRDVQIETGKWDANNTNFLVDCTVLSTATLSPGDGITIRAQISDTLPTLKLSYYTGSDCVEQFILYNATDGTVILEDS